LGSRIWPADAGRPSVAAVRPPSRPAAGLRVACGVLVACLSLAGGARAQTAGQITPPSFRPPLQGGAGSLVIPEGPGLEAPPGAERLTVRLADVVVEGGLPAMAETTRSLLAGLAHRTVTAAEIFAAARALEAAYVQAGYVLVRVVLPAQSLEDGAALRLVVVDGYIERIETGDVPEPVRARIEAVLAPLVGQRGVTLALLERKLLLAGDTPGTILRSTLAAGAAPGASVLTVDARHRPVAGQLTVDNTLASALGRWTTGIGADFNSVAGFGELVYLRAGGYPTGGTNGFLTGEPRNRALAAGVVMPLGTDGLTLNLEAAGTRATPRPAAGGLGFASAFERYSARLRYPWIRGRDLTLNGEASFDAQEERLEALAPVSAPLSLDRLRILRASGDGAWFVPWGGLLAGGVLTGGVTASVGLDGLGARSAADATPLLPLSRQGADAAFRKLEVALGYSQPLAEHLALDLRARAQTAFNQPLASSEQFGLASLSGLSAFDAGTFQGDAGYVLRGELSAPWSVPLPGGAAALAPYAFGAFGQVHLENPTALEAADIRGAAYGLGLRLGAATEGNLGETSLTLEWGRQSRSDGLPDDDRVTVVGAVRF
jgi:hemolysin activation/secretion protein